MRSDLKEAPAGVQAVAAGERLSQVLSGGNRKASGTITYASQLAANATVTINGVVFTAKASGAVGNQFNIGTDLATTLANLLAVLVASTVPAVALGSYSATGTVLTVVYDTYGVQGNAFTLAASTGGTVSAATLTGGAQGAPYDAFKAELDLLVTKTGGDQDFLLANGDEGQSKTVFFKTKAASSNAILKGTFAGGTKITFSAAAQMAQLKWIAGAWRILSNTGTLS